MKVPVNPGKGGCKLGERWHLSPKFSREFEGLVSLNSHFSLSKVGLYYLVKVIREIIKGHYLPISSMDFGANKLMSWTP